MDQVIWIEILRHRDVAARFRCPGPTVRIGRGYDNDVLIDDPHVAAHQLLIRRDETGALVAENVGGSDGFFVDRGAGPVQRIVLDGDRTLRIGVTTLRVRDASYAVPRERAWRPAARLWPASLALAVTLLGVEALSEWLAETGEPKLSRYLMPLLGIGFFALAWAAMWATFSRIFAGQARFARNLLIGLAALMVLSLYNMLGDAAAFALSWPAILAYRYVGLWLLLGAACFFHLEGIGGPRARLKGGIVAAMVAIGIAAQFVSQWDAHAGIDQQSFTRRLLPPALRLAPYKSEDAFFAEIDALKVKLDRDRAEDADASRP